jgi:uncharacterized protein YbaP (TraB family)
MPLILQRAVARTPNARQLGPALGHMKPWFATLNLAISPMESAGFQAGAGADIVLAGRAHEQGKAVRGFETIEQQLDLLPSRSEEQQLNVLRHFLAIPDAMFDSCIETSASIYRAWMKGDVAPLTARIDACRTGVAYVAVGAGHLVGPDSVQAKLGARGIEVRSH